MEDFINTVRDLATQHGIKFLSAAAFTGAGWLIGRYLICLTNECDGEVRTRKVRAMVIRKDSLMNLPKEQPGFESPTHAIRWKTLQQMQKAYAADPTNFIEAEIVV